VPHAITGDRSPCETLETDDTVKAPSQHRRLTFHDDNGRYTVSLGNRITPARSSHRLRVLRGAATASELKGTGFEEMATASISNKTPPVYGSVTVFAMTPVAADKVPDVACAG